MNKGTQEKKLWKFDRQQVHQVVFSSILRIKEDYMTDTVNSFRQKL